MLRYRGVAQNPSATTNRCSVFFKYGRPKLFAAAKMKIQMVGERRLGRRLKAKPLHSRCEAQDVQKDLFDAGGERGATGMMAGTQCLTLLRGWCGGGAVLQ